MDLLLLLMMPLVLVGSEVQNVTEVRGKLGQDVSLNCSIMDADVFWSMEIHHHFRFSIGRSFFPTDKASYNSTELKTKYLINGTRLEIKNMSSEDGRLYYCGRTIHNSISAEESFLLLLLPDSPDSSGINLGDVVTYSSLALNLVLVLVVLGLIVSLKRKINKFQENKCSGPIDENPERLETVQYEEIQLPDFRPPPPPECVYYKVQLPGS
ncbi:uncharacterized protein LOC125001120 [Mugil cephalus]|uniref:uncharacterized protein LOC125001120 n=1 Tax=Mugil cephalus TaxID=48193 RepID=UPI001FB7BC51|nr:uncharacterized protein LOC125001120 [Mugil cephalus]